jgi:probable F420-dependent oxidoreductase
MRIGVVFPHHAIGADPLAARDWAQAADELGIDDIIVYEHLILPDAASHPDRQFRYTNTLEVHEPLTLCAFFAGVTRRIGLQTGVLVLPLRETVVVAKQAAEVDLLSSGRLRLGVGAGWMEFEFETLGQDFHERGARLDEQMTLLRMLWTNAAVRFKGRLHRIDGAGLNPLPVQRPIPLWVGGGVRASLRRAARLGDGWMLQARYMQQLPDAQAHQLLEWLHQEEEAAGRPVGSVAIQAPITIRSTSEADWVTHAEAWQLYGATHLFVDTGVTDPSGDPSLASIEYQIQSLHRIKTALEPLASDR